jgi:hypothetical protein
MLWPFDVALLIMSKPKFWHSALGCRPLSDPNCSSLFSHQNSFASVVFQLIEVMIAIA